MMSPVEAATVPAAGGGTVAVTVAFSPAPGEVEQVALVLPSGSRIDDAWRASGLLERHPQLPELPCGIWGRACPRDTVLRDGDRVEAWRALCFDPMASRRRRQAHREAQRLAGGSARRRRAGSPPLSDSPS